MEKNNKKGGWRENADPTCVNKKGKPVARKHHEVTVRKEVRNEYGSTLRIPLFASLKPRDKEDEDLAEDIIEEVQENRKPDVISRDNFRTAERVDDQDEPEEPEEFEEPEESDIKDEDDKKNESEKNEDEEE